MSPDGKRLYFSSQGHSTMGGFDAFYSELLADGSFHEVPVNLGYPLNSSDDDYTYSPESIIEANTSFIFSHGKMPEYDLFKFAMIGREQTPVPVSMDEALEPEVRSPRNDHFPAYIVGVVTGVGRGNADALEGR